MITEIATTVAKLDWIGWAKGLVAAFIGGGASSVSAGFGSMFTDPEHFNLGTSPHGLRHLFTVMGITFLISGVVSLAAYLKQSPVPPAWDGQERRQEPLPQPAQ